MPLIVISGGPCSGKSTRAQALYEYFQTKSMPVQMITDNHLDRNAVYAGFLFPQEIFDHLQRFPLIWNR